MACGDQLKFQIEVGEDGVVKQAVFKAFGCGSAMASSAYATELVKGKHIDELAGIKNSGKLYLDPRHLQLLESASSEASLQHACRRRYKASFGGLQEEEYQSRGHNHH